MEFLNKVQIRGVVGHVQTIPVGKEELTRFSVMTQHNYKLNGFPFVETTWWDCRSFGKEAKSLAKGDQVDVQGRLTGRTYINNVGTEVRTTVEVICSIVRPLRTPAEIVAMNASKEQNGHIVK